MTSNARRPHAQGWAVLTIALTFAAPATPAARAATTRAAEPALPRDDARAAAHAAPPASGEAADEPARDAGLPLGPPAPPAPGWVRVESVPAGARIWINGLDAGPAPVAPFETPSGRVVVRAFLGDPRRFQHVSDGMEGDLAPGETLWVRLDLRPRVLLRSDPEPATVTMLPPRPDEPEIRVGATPLRLAPARLEGRRLRLGARGFADSLLSGSAIAAAGASGDPVSIALRPLDLPPAAPPPSPSLVGRRWFQWALIGTGTALTGGAAVLRREGDRTYERYLAATRPDEIERLYDRAVRYDRWSSVTLGAGQVALTAGVFLLISGLGR